MGTAFEPHEDCNQQYFDCLCTGVEKCRAKDCTVAVVGAGMAGLVTAWLLKEAHFKVDVFEASLRVGGRVRTLREGFSSGLYAEAGAMRIPQHHTYTLALCKKFHLFLFPFPEEEAKIYVGGVRRNMSDYKNGAPLGQPYDNDRIVVNSYQQAMDRLRNYVKFKDPQGTEPRTPEESKKRLLELDSHSLGGYLHAFVNPPDTITGYDVLEEQKLKLTDIDLIGFYVGASNLRASLLEVYRDEENFLGKSKYQIAGGMDLLPWCFLGVEGSTPSWMTKPKQRFPLDLMSKNKWLQDKRLSGDEPLPDLSNEVHFHSRVTTVKRLKGGYNIEYENPITHRVQNTDAEYVVLAAPFSALTHIRFDGQALSDDRLRAIRNLHYENATKIVLEFSKRFWETGPNKIDTNGGRSYTDLPIRWVYYPPKDQTPLLGDRGLLLASYTWGDDSLRWGSLKPHDRIRFALRDVAELHKFKVGELQNLLVGGMSHSWAQDEFTFGAFAICDPHQEKEIFEHVWPPYENIHFAGEHASYRHAWIEGAVESGIRVAMEISAKASGRTKG